MASEAPAFVVVRRRRGFVHNDVACLVELRAFVHGLHYWAEEPQGSLGINPSYCVEGGARSIFWDASFAGGIIVYRMWPVTGISYITLRANPYSVWVYLVCCCRGGLYMVGSEWGR